MVLSSMFLFRFLQNTDVRALSLVFSAPWWPACSLDRISPWTACGTTIRWPLKIKLSSMDISSRQVQWGRISEGSSLTLVGHPSYTTSLRAERSGSLAVSARIFFKHSLVCTDVCFIWHITHRMRKNHHCGLIVIFELKRYMAHNILMPIK